MKSILVLDHHGLGNVVMSIPFLRSVSDWCVRTGCVFHLLLNSRGHAELIENSGISCVVHFLNPDFSGIGGRIHMRRVLGGKIDLVLAVPQVPVKVALAVRILIGARWVGAESFAWSAWLLSYSVRKYWTGSILNAQEALLAAVGISQTCNQPYINLRDGESALGLQLVRRALPGRWPLIAIHAASGEVSKRWPAENFKGLCSRIQTVFPNAGFVFVGGDSEKADSEIAAKGVGNGAILWGVGEWKLRTTSAVLRNCILLISGDTGLMHIAAAVGTQTLSLFAPTSPSRLAPTYNNGSYIIPNVSCHPCFRDKFSACDCIKHITVDQVLVRIRQFVLKSYA